MRTFSVEGKVANQWIVFNVEEAQGQLVISAIDPARRDAARPVIKFRCPKTFQSDDEILEEIRAKFHVRQIRWL